MLHLRLAVPGDLSEQVLAVLEPDDAVCNLAVTRGGSLKPVGDLVEADIAREATDAVLGRLRDLGLHDRGGITILTIEAAPSRNAVAAERHAPGAPDDAVVWDAVLDGAEGQSHGSWSYYAFLCLATLIASVAVVTDSAILVVGAMVVGPEFSAVAALAVGLALGRPRLSLRAMGLLVRGFALAIAVTTLLSLLAVAVGWFDASTVAAPRPLTGFIWRPDHWSVVVAVLAGAAGVLSTTAGRSNALVGVFISVTTVPAAGDFSVALATGAWSQLGGAAAQLGINLLGMTVAGVLTLLAQRALWGRLHRRRQPTPA
ncbi:MULTISPECIES: DUF389 domain-containing protein [unclassified Phycicoccus]|uniref:DUF389 domain-containing protein n=1 Tax=unclassified Phycicoccus TaxID=2637926 RepID=UPI000702D62A|nr:MULTISPECIES: DUF389 domain-containing protein [unclassified Phycicoccus]KQU69294.1 hypothetical protein ASC58_05200 [Phycicoccus sp. Root101]KQZ90496.1 hypothetical protein ASD62_15620 [Phycicoccus sp. Root563]